MKNADVIETFMIHPGTKARNGQGNLRIEGAELISYHTTIAFRQNGKFFFNVTHYSPTTSRVQSAVIRWLAQLQLDVVEIEMGRGQRM